jgi:quercetin dioxygenase-like cupin family protein
MSPTEQSHEIATDLAGLLAQAPVDPTRLRPRHIYDGFGARLVLLPFAKGQELREHTASLPILVHVLTGTIRFETEGQSHQLEAGGMINVAARVPHALFAEEDSHVLLMLLG